MGFAGDLNMTVLLDKNVFTNLAKGNAAVCHALTQLLGSGEPVYIARGAYNELVRDSPVRLRMGYELLLRDLKITTAPAAASSITDRGNFLADNITYEPQQNQPGRVDEYGKGKSKATPADAFIAAEAKAMNARLWTLDENFAKRAKNLGVTLARECQIKATTGNNEDVGQARRLMGLRPLSMLQNVKTAAAKPGPSNPPSGRPVQEKGTTGEVGAPIEPVQEYGPDARGDAKFQGATLALEGVNLVLQKINSAIQSKRFQAEWTSRWLPEVRRRLDADPQLGALVLIYYSKAQGDAESAIDTATVFQGGIQVGYGLNPDDAMRDAQSRPSIIPGTPNVGDTLWIKPRAPMDVKRLKLPFGCTIAGLATFVPGKEKLVRVKFSGRMGFDDKLFSKEELTVPAGMTPRFCYLWPPDKINYFQFGKWQTKEVDWEISNEADVSHGKVDPFLSGVPVVKLDSSLNPYNATAAMVWPADNSTANLFQTAGATQDNNGLLRGKGIDPLRWVRPEFIRILKAPLD
jgi:predicted nucleic acid-binding protein